ncbi:MAG: replication-associated recombination protein A [Ignavibacteriales bacterium]
MHQKQPLAYRMSPKSLEEYVGQENIIGEGKLLFRMVQADKLSSIIFWGPPGTGKTALARVISNYTKNKFEKINAVTSGVAEIKSIIAEAKNVLMNPSGRVVLFIDEIHRFNKAQQDALLPAVEDGTVILIGATTENPFFEVNKALLSRSTVFKLESLTKEHIIKIIKNTIQNKERGFGNLNINISDKTIEFLADLSNGDARTSLNALELAVLTTPVDGQGNMNIDNEIIKECLQQRTITYDKNADGHYDNISAFIKSMRGSDPDAAVFYLARALAAGEDPVFMARRIILCAAEDVGMANPQALVVASSAAQAVHMIGMPEARIILAEAAVYVATSPKSNASYIALENALGDVKNKDTGEIPYHIRNAAISGMSEFGYGEGYKYAHDYEGNYVKQQFLPDIMKDTIYYKPTNNGYEVEVKEYMKDKWEVPR